MKNFKNFSHLIHAESGDITKWKGDSIVNAANPSLLGGGGVDGAIHRTAGPELLKECKLLHGCKHGEARLTRGYNLPSKYIIHTPGPIYQNGTANEEKTLKNSYQNSLKIARAKSFKSIAFPAISTGVYGFPKEKASKIALTTIIEFMNKNYYLPEIYFILFDNENLMIYTNFLRNLKKT